RHVIDAAADLPERDLCLELQRLGGGRRRASGGERERKRRRAPSIRGRILEGRTDHAQLPRRSRALRRTWTVARLTGSLRFPAPESYQAAGRLASATLAGC